MSGSLPHNLFWGAGRNNLTAAHAALRPHVNYMVSNLYHIHVVLNHKHRVPTVNQLLQHVQQNPYVLEMKPGGRFVKNIECPAGILAAQFRRKLYPLRLPARKRGGGLPQRKVPKPHLLYAIEGIPSKNGRASLTFISSTSLIDFPL